MYITVRDIFERRKLSVFLTCVMQLDYSFILRNKNEYFQRWLGQFDENGEKSDPETSLIWRKGMRVHCSRPEGVARRGARPVKDPECLLT